jgi:hypothetical protein
MRAELSPGDQLHQEEMARDLGLIGAQGFRNEQDKLDPFHENRTRTFPALANV